MELLQKAFIEATEILQNDPKLASKPPMVIEKMVEGKINKYYDENCLLRQAFVKDPDLTVEAFAKNNPIQMNVTPMKINVVPPMNVNPYLSASSNTSSEKWSPCTWLEHT